MTKVIKVHPMSGVPASSILSRINRERIINLLARGDSMTRSQIAQGAGLTAPAISRITRRMLDARILLESEPIPSQGRVGRRETLLSINPDGAYVLGISITANRRSVTLANARGEPLETLDCGSLSIEDPERFLGELALRAKSLIYDCDFSRSRLLGVGVSAALSAGTGHPLSEDLVTSNPLGWRNVPIKRILENRLDLPVKVEHRSSAILRAELKSVQPELDVYLVNVALGIGASARLDGQFLASGDRGFGALSHFSVQGNETRCYCGKKGCLEAVSGGFSVLRELGRGDCPPEAQARRLNETVSAANSGNREYKDAFKRAGRRLGIGIDAVHTLMRPDKFILSGEVGRQHDFFAGVVDALNEFGLEDPAKMLEMSDTTSAEAAVQVALEGFVFTGAMDMKSLKVA